MSTSFRDHGWSPYPTRQIVNYFPSSGALACWNFDQSGSYLTDRTGNGHNLAWLSGGASWQTEWSMPSLRFDSNRRLRAPNDEALRIAKDNTGGGDASLTVEMILGHDTPTVSRRMMCLAADGETPANNYLFDWSSGGGSYWYIFTEYGNGTNNGFTPSGALTANPAVYVAHKKFPVYHACTVSSDGKTWTTYTNGVKNGSNTLGTAPQKGTSGNAQRWVIGGHPGSNNWYGNIMAVRLTDSVLSDQDIEDRYVDDLSEPASFAKFFDIKAGIEDRLTFPTAGGPDSYQETIQRGVGQTVPGAVTRSTTKSGNSQQMKDQAAYEDRLTFPTGGGPPTWEREDDSSMGFLPPDQDQDSRVPRYPHYEASYEDRQTVLRLSSSPQFSDSTSDSEGHPHFNAATNAVVGPWFGHYYYTDEEPWANPTAHSDFTGFARNGKRYTNGVEDAGPTWAPWAAEGASNDRSSRVDFPSKALVLGTWEEVIIYDCDNYDPLDHTTLKVWMRFRQGTTGNTMLIRGWAQGRDCKMVNGVLYIVTKDGDGGTAYLASIDFRAEGQNTTTLIGSTNNYRLLSGYTIADRNVENIWTTSGMTQAMHIYSENLYRVDAFAGDVLNNAMYVMGVGEDTGDGVFYYENNVPQWHSIMQGPDRGDVNLYDYWYRDVLFDRQGWLWTTVNDRLFRHLDYYKDQALRQEIGHPQQQSITLPSRIRDIVAARNHLYAIVDDGGIYKIDRATMEYHLAYTVDRGGGQGREDGLGLGEILHGEESQGYKLTVLNLETASYLGVMMCHVGNGEGIAGCTVVRLYDDQVILGYTYPQLNMDGGYMVYMVPY